MSTVSISGSTVGGALQELLMSDDIQPGSDPSYQLCKTIYLYHPLGVKMTESPVSVAMSQKRDISIPNSPENLIRDAFLAKWKEWGVDKLIYNAMKISRIYGISAVAIIVDGEDSKSPVNLETISASKISFNVLDPLNTAGSLVLNQNPNSADFQKSINGITAAGQTYHPSRCAIKINEDPIYISYSGSAFGFVGRSVFQRALFPLKSFIQSMITNDLIITKAGVLISKTKQPGSIVDNFTSSFMRQKRDMIKESKQGNVISVGIDEEVESLDMHNADSAIGQARKNIIEDVASSANMPPKLLLSDSYASVMANGTEDFKSTMQYIANLREDMESLYEFFDRIVQHSAWNAEFYATIQNQFPQQYGDVDYRTAFYQWSNDFEARWPSLLEEPESDKADVEKVKLDAIIGVLEKLSPMLDPENKARLVEWAASNINENKIMFSNPLDIDFDALASYAPTEPVIENVTTD